jgi:hypothetical protein
VVIGEHGWWQACAAIGAPGYDPFGPQGANFNLLIGSAALDPISGTASHRAYLCDVRLTTPIGFARLVDATEGEERPSKRAC